MPRRATRIDPAVMTRCAPVIKCLGHALRLTLLEALEDGAKSVTQLEEYSGAPQAMVSQQLATLRGYGIVTAERDGQFIRYRITEPKVHHILACIRECGS